MHCIPRVVHFVLTWSECSPLIDGIWTKAIVGFIPLPVPEISQVISNWS